MSDNPLLEQHELPPFQRIRPEHVEPAIDQLLADNLREIERLLEAGGPRDWAFVEALEVLEERLSRAWSPVSHLNSVRNSEDLRQAYNACLPKLSDYSTRVGQNERLYEAYLEVLEHHRDQLDDSQRQALENAVRDFQLAGVALRDDKKARFAAINKRLSELGSRFNDNLLDATMAWTRLVNDEDELRGLPDSVLEQARARANEKGETGYLFSLDIPSYLPLMTYAENRPLRREMYEAYVTRASDQGPKAGKWDNGPLIEEILALRQEKARLLGYDNYAQLSLVKKMAPSTWQVVDFLEGLASKSLPVGRQEYEELSRFAADELGLATLEPWDIPFVSERLRQRTYAISQEELRPWFPLDKVLEGLFAIAGRLYGLSFERDADVEVWHEQARFYHLKRGEERIAAFYLDLYAREHKKGGAWMDECRVRWRRPDGELQRPVAYLVCNFTPPVGGRPPLLTHNEVTTLFHEFGHGLHHMLTRVDHPAVAGINGVAWDAVELPSQLLENWCWRPESVPLISAHFETGAPLPAELLDKLLAARNFQAGMQMLRQLEFALFDFRLHLDYEAGSEGQVGAILADVRRQVSLYPVPEWNRFQTSFSHIFGGGYAAGYYSYKWAEVLSADVFERFQEVGILEPAAGEEFLDKILSRGGSRPAMELFKDYRGREPAVEPLLRAAGML